jgi:hypothetical protein
MMKRTGDRNCDIYTNHESNGEIQKALSSWSMAMAGFKERFHLK